MSAPGPAAIIACTILGCEARARRRLPRGRAARRRSDLAELAARVTGERRGPGGADGGSIGAATRCRPAIRVAFVVVAAATLRLLHQPLPAWLAERARPPRSARHRAAGVEVLYALLRVTPLWWLAPPPAFAFAIALTAVLPIGSCRCFPS